MHRAAHDAPPPNELDVALAEAIGRRDISPLTALAPMLRPEILDATLLCGATPVQLAVQSRQPASAEWLVQAGATLDVLSAWELGWKHRVPALLQSAPDLVNRRGGPLRTTPLHEATARGDLELARVLLAAHPDLTARDAEYHATSLGWPEHFGRVEMVQLLRQVGG